MSLMLLKAIGYVRLKGVLNKGVPSNICGSFFSTSHLCEYFTHYREMIGGYNS